MREGHREILLPHEGYEVNPGSAGRLTGFNF